MTLIDQGGVNQLRKLFTKHQLPTVEFSHWTAEYGREVWEMVSFMTKPDTMEAFVEPRDELLKVLDAMDVFSDNKEDHQWKPPNTW